MVDSGIVDVEFDGNTYWFIQYCSWFIVDSGCVNEEALISEECEEIDNIFSWTFNDLMFTLVFDAIV